jgi:transposase
MRDEPRTQAYVERRVEEGVSKPEIMRVRKRYVAREVFRFLPRRELTLTKIWSGGLGARLP